MQRDDERLLDMLVSARKIAARMKAVSRKEFEGDEFIRWAVIHLIQIIGEAARGVSDETRAAHPEIPWHEVIGMRHRIVHDYLNVNLAKAWETATQDIPALVAAIEPIVPPEEP